MKKYLLSIFAVCVSISLFAQEAEKPSPWKCTGVVGLNASAGVSSCDLVYLLAILCVFLGPGDFYLCLGVFS